MIIACTAHHESLRASIDALDKHIMTTGSYVIIPNQGCEGCISKAEDFVKKNINKSDNIRYIFTRIQSTKLLRIKLGSDVMTSNKILFDTGNTIQYPDKKNDIYPMIVTFHNQRIAGITYQSPTDDGLSKLF
jgi:CRISPR/Cas system-associated endonuclease Cas3-HD